MRYEALDSLRGICACGVVLYHLRATGVISNLALVREGWLFVDVFFVLSGFVIAASYGEKLKRGFPLSAYLILRFGRIYPLHLFMILAYVALELAMIVFAVRGITGREPFTGERSLPFLAANLFLVQIFVPAAGFSWNGPSWSIAAEMWTYLLTAIGLVWLKRRFRLVLVAIVVAAPLIGLFGRDYLWTGLWPLLRCLFGFSIGMLAFALHERLGAGARLGRGGATLAEAAVLLVCGAAIALVPSGPLLIACPFLFALAILVVAREEGAVSDALKLAPMRALGAWSYSIYMVHGFVIVLFVNACVFAGRWLGIGLAAQGFAGGRPIWVLAGEGLMPELLVLAGLGLVILAASITYKLVELPFRNASRRLAERIARRPVAAAERVAPTM